MQCRQHATRSLGHRRASERRGAVMVAVLAALGLALALSVAMLQASAFERRLVRRQAWQGQADWLAEAALRRAAARLAEEPAWPGETWTVPPGDLGGPHGGQVTIAVTEVADQPGRRQVRIRADYPIAADLPARSTTETPIVVTVPVGS